jgi:hypothetical protein
VHRPASRCRCKGKEGERGAAAARATSGTARRTPAMAQAHPGEPIPRARRVIAVWKDGQGEEMRTAASASASKGRSFDLRFRAISKRMTPENVP